MTILVKGKGHHRSVIFKRRAMADQDVLREPVSESYSGNRLYSDQPPPGVITEEQPQIIDEIESSFYGPAKIPPAMSATTVRASPLPELFTTLPPIHDLLNTESSQIQEETIQECLPFLSGLQPGVKYNEHGVPHLDRKRHIQFLHKSLRRLPAPYVAADASRPWMFYWALTGLSVMGEDISQYRERVIATVRPIQNITGGFGGGNGQMSHLAPTYAIILSLAMVGGSEALDLVDRKAMWKWLGALKQPDGGFQMSVGGEEDIR
jgi:protein farnesyltransferase subunit beta